MAKFLGTLLLVAFSKLGESTPHIYDSTYDFCEYKFDKTSVRFPNKLWTVTNGGLTLHFSLCKPVESVCGPNAASCLVDGSSRISAGTYFEIDPDAVEMVLVSKKGDRCPTRDGSYSVTVNFDCRSTINVKPRMRVDDEDPCKIEVTMMRPDCEPKCTSLVREGYFVDLRKFPKSLAVRHGSRNFSLTLCGPSKSCSASDVSSCELFSNAPPAAIAVTTSQRLNYDVRRDRLSFEGKYKSGKVRRTLEVIIKCKWDFDLTDAIYDAAPTQGRNYKFELFSSYGCVKLPQICTMTSIDNLHFNLSSLYKTNSYWLVDRVPASRTILLNICGPLKLPAGNQCYDQYSQVCEKQGKTFINRGSILQALERRDGSVIAKFSSGSTCRENNSLLYSTEIELKCSRLEKGPVFQQYSGCLTELLWETPKACPVDHYEGDNCQVADHLSNRNLQKLWTNEDKVSSLSSNGRLTYNLCGPLHVSCNDHTNASFCLKLNGRDYVIGWDNKRLISDNGELKMDLFGELCPNRRSHGKVVIHFLCNFEATPPPPLIRVLEDNCQFDVTISTPLACGAENRFHDCNFTDKNSGLCYDLSPLVLKNRNHIVRDEGSGFEYSLNVCGPVVTNAQALCWGEAMVCRKNQTEANFKDRFLSLGSPSRPTLQNSTLVIEASMGSYCPGFGHYKSIIQFVCSSNEEKPKLLKKEPCIYHFIWKTRHACPKHTLCNFPTQKLDLFVDLFPLTHKSLAVSSKNGTKYIFDLCSTNYSRCDKNGACEPETVVQKSFFKGQNFYLELDLGGECASDDVMSRVLIEGVCDKISNNEHYEEFGLENCTMKVVLKAELFCQYTQYVDKESVSTEYAVVKIPPEMPREQKQTWKNDYQKVEIATEALQVVKQVSKNDYQKLNSCSFVDNDGTSHEINLSGLNSSKLLHADRNSFQLNFDGKLPNCGGLICEDNTELVPFLDECPRITFNSVQSLVEVHFLERTACGKNGFGNVSLLLMCSKEVPVVRRGPCNVTFEFEFPDMCSQSPFSSTTTAVAVSMTVALAAILAIVGTLWYRKFREKRCLYNDLCVQDEFYDNKID